MPALLARLDSGVQFSTQAARGSQGGGGWAARARCTGPAARAAVKRTAPRTSAAAGSRQRTAARHVRGRLGVFGALDGQRGFLNAPGTHAVRRAFHAAACFAGAGAAFPAEPLGQPSKGSRQEREETFGCVAHGQGLSYYDGTCGRGAGHTLQRANHAGLHAARPRLRQGAGKQLQACRWNRELAE
jgi:hypothetical protein